jgi:hypothetical protein
VLRLVALVGMVSGCDVVWSVDRVPPPDAPGPCVATDDFAGDRLGNQWATFQNNPLFVIAQNETLRLELSANSAPGEAGVRYGVAFDMTGGSIEVEVAQVVNAHPNVETYLRVREGTDNSRNYTIRYGDGALDFRTRLGTDNIHRQRAYSATADRWWRISNGPELGQVSFATRASRDEAWFIETTQPATVPFANVQIALVAGTYNSGSPDPGLAMFDNFAVCSARPL